MSCKTGNWLYTDSKVEAIKCLEKLEELLERVEADSYQWKWAIIVLHNCIQCFMVLALEGTAQIDVIRDEEIIIEYLNPKIRKKNVQLACFLDLYTKIKKDKYMKKYGHSKAFKALSEHNKAMKQINLWRNQYIHFFPESWHFEVSGLPEIFINVIDIIEFLVKESGNFLYRFEEIEKDKVECILSCARERLEKAYD